MLQTIHINEGDGVINFSFLGDEKIGTKAIRRKSLWK